jgi:hypothetical protein
LVLLLCYVLAGCEQADAPRQQKTGSQSGIDPRRHAIPNAVQTLIDAPISADGEVHIQSHGLFEVGANSFDCVMPARGSPALLKLAPGFYGVGPGKHVRLDGPGVDGRICRDDGKNQVSSLILRPNRSGKPYRLTLAIWQGDASWVASIERSNGRRADVSVMPIDDIVPARQTRKRAEGEIEAELVRWSIARDYRSMEGLFTESVAK